MKHSLAFAAVVAALGVAGCATQKPMTTSASNAGAINASAAQQAAAAAAGQHSSYVVRKGDSLWKIAAKGDVLGDPFRWPLLFKANRDQIQDPDFIQVDDDLSYRSSYTADEIADAVKKAQLTPAYEPRKRPRKVLPIQY